jgi:hypothetical protein
MAYAHPSTPELFGLDGREKKLFSFSFPPYASSGPETARQSPKCRLLSADGSMLLHEPAPNAIPDIMVDYRELIARPSAEAEVIFPAT